MELILFTSPGEIENELDIINQAFEEGLTILHFRKPDWSKTKCRDFLSCVREQFHDRIMVHQHYDLLEEFNLRGIHLTEKTKGDLNLYLDEVKNISMACHSLSELSEFSDQIEYAIVSPVFDSISKQDYKANIDLKQLSILLKSKKQSYKIFALGGVDLQTIPELKRTGCNGVCVLGAFWNQEKVNRIQYLKQLQNLCR